MNYLEMLVIGAFLLFDGLREALVNLLWSLDVLSLSLLLVLAWYAHKTGLSLPNVSLNLHELKTSLKA